MTSKKRKYGDLSARVTNSDPSLLDDVFRAFTGQTPRPDATPAGTRTEEPADTRKVASAGNRNQSNADARLKVSSAVRNSSIADTRKNDVADTHTLPSAGVHTTKAADARDVY